MEPATGIVLRSVDFSETSKVVTMFTRELGKIAALAKGGRRIKSTFDLSLDVLSVCRICVIRKPHAELDVLTEARLEERFVGLQRDLPALYAGYFAVEIVDALTQLHEPHAAIFNGTVTCVRQLASGHDRLRALARHAARLLVELGYGPRLDACCVCQAPGLVGETTAYSIQAGGVVCLRCKSNTPGLMRVPSSAIKALAVFAAENDRDWSTVPLDEKNRGPVWRILVTHIHSLLGRPTRMGSLVKL